jgi:hypothetical protein
MRARMGETRRSRSSYGPWAKLEVGQQFEVPVTTVPVAVLVRRIRAAADQWAHRLPDRSFHVLERPDAVVVRRIA